MAIIVNYSIYFLLEIYNNAIFTLRNTLTYTSLKLERTPVIKNKFFWISWFFILGVDCICNKGSKCTMI